MTAKHWTFNGTDVDLKDYSRNQPNGIISKVNGVFTVAMLPTTYIDHLTITNGSTVQTLYDYMDTVKGV